MMMTTITAAIEAKKSLLDTEVEAVDVGIGDAVAWDITVKPVSADDGQ